MVSELHPEYIEFLNNEIKEFDKELISIFQLPDVSKLRSRIKKDKRDTEAMLRLYKDITNTNEKIREVKIAIRGCIATIKEQLGFNYGVGRHKERSNGYYPSEDLSEE